jgi:hypothetical protein
MSEICEVQKRYEELEKSYKYLQEENIRLIGTQYKVPTIKLEMPWWYHLCIKLFRGIERRWIDENGVLSIIVFDTRFEPTGGP